MKLNVELVPLKPYERYTGKLYCLLSREDATDEQFNSMIEYLGFKPVRRGLDFANYELQFNSQVENLKRRFIDFVKSDYGHKDI